jgi:hypothetical protein
MMWQLREAVSFWCVCKHKNVVVEMKHLKWIISMLVVVFHSHWKCHYFGWIGVIFSLIICCWIMILFCIIKINVTCSDILCIFILSCVVYQLNVNNRHKHWTGLEKMCLTLHNGKWRRMFLWLLNPCVLV